MFGFILLGAIVANLDLALLPRRPSCALWASSGRFSAHRRDARVFLTWVYPANQATANWTTVPEDWERLRRQWECGHAVNAVLTFLALGATTAVALLDWP
jgi:hypothetical protein